MAIKDTIKGLIGKPEREGDKQYDDTYWVEYTEAKFEESKNFRSANIERQWFINDAYYRGWHNVRYNKDTGKLSWGSRDPLDFQINQTYSICRAIRGAVTRTQPTWDVDALPYAQLDPGTSQVLGQYLGFVYDKLRMKQLVKKAVLFGLLYGQGIFQYGYDANADDGEGLPWVQVLDPFDTYIDPYAKDMESARYVVKVISRPKEIVEKNPNYDQDAIKDLSTTSKTSESMYKELINTSSGDTSSTSSNMLLHETWCVTDEGIRVVTTSEGKILRNELTNFKKLPFEIYFPDINTNEIYGEGWVKNIVPLNKALNYLEKAILEYNILFSKGKYSTDSNSGIKIINNKNGQILRHKPGHTIQQMDMKPMSSTPFKQIDNLKDYMQNIGAAHEAFMGKAPAGVTAGVAFDTLVANAYTNIVDLIDNLADTLSRLGEDILELGYDYQLISKPFRTETGDIYSVISGQVDEVPEGATIIPKNPEVKVKITGGISHTKEGKREILTMLRGGGDISRQTLLQNFDIDPEEEKQRLAEEKMEMVEMAMAQEQMMAPPPPPEGMPPELEQQIPPEEALTPNL
jgi:hypothetical protein